MISLSKRGVASIKTACFRVDAGPGIGLGHFMRCKTIGLELYKRGWTVSFVGENLPVDGQKPLAGFNIIERKTSPDDYLDMSLFLTELAKGRCSIPKLIFFDSYKFSQRSYAEVDSFLRPGAGLIPSRDFITIVIDDIANRDTPAQVVINPNPQMSPEPYERQHIPTIMCGSKYTIIRPKIVKLREREYNSHGHILITLGGGDVSELMLKILRCMPADLDRTVCVSISKDCPVELIREWVDEKPDKRFINMDVDAFPELLAGASLAITAGGTTLWEVYCLGIPCITVVWVDNQANTINAIKNEATGFLVDLISKASSELDSDILRSASDYLYGSATKSQNSFNSDINYKICEIIHSKKTGLLIDETSSINKQFFKESLKKLLSNENLSYEMRTKQRNLIDGKGVERIVDTLESLEWSDVPLFF